MVVLYVMSVTMHTFNISLTELISNDRGKLSDTTSLLQFKVKQGIDLKAVLVLCENCV